MMKAKKQGILTHLKITYTVMFPSILAIMFVVLLQEGYLILAIVDAIIMMFSWVIIASKLLELKIRMDVKDEL